MLETISMPDGTHAKTLEELRGHFDLVSVLEHYTSGKLLKWLEDLGYGEEAKTVASMNPFMPRFEEALCSLLQVPFSLEETMSIYEKAAGDNCAEAQFRLGCCYLFGYGIIINRGPKGMTKNNKKVKKGAELTKKAAEQGHPFAQYSLGNYYRHVLAYATHREGYEEPEKWYQKAADQGYIEAQYSLRSAGSCLKAAEHGHIRAQVLLGQFFFNGNGVGQDYGEAVKWYRKAAEQGDMEAQYRLSLCYLCGNGVKEDYEEGVKWCFKAAEKEGIPAEFRLGEWYFYGYGVDQDFYEAGRWYHRAFEKEAKWNIINKIDLCIGIILGTELTLKHTEPPGYFRGVRAQQYLEAYVPNEEYNDNVKWLLAGGLNGGIRSAGFYSRYAGYEIPMGEDELESLWYWRYANRMRKDRPL